MGGEFVALVPGQRANELCGQFLDALFERVCDVLCGALVAQPGQHHVAGLALDQGRDKRAALFADQQIAFPVARDGAVFNLRRPLRDRHHLADLSALAQARAARPAAGSLGPQIGRKLAAQLAPGLDIERLVDRLVADPQLRIIGIVGSQSGRYLLRRPAPQKACLDRGQQPRAARQLAAPGPPRAADRPLLGGQRAIAAAAAVGRKLASDRRRRTAQLPSDRPSALARRQTAADQLPLTKRQAQLRQPNPAALDQRSRIDALHRAPRAAQPNRNLSLVITPPQTLKHPTTLNRTQPPTPPRHPRRHPKLLSAATTTQRCNDH